jgi:hypothetical protein
MFKLFKKNDATIPVIKEIPAAAGTYNVGDALAYDDGLLAKAAGSTTPEYISAGKGTLASGDTLAVNPIFDDMEFLTTWSAAAGSVNAGEKVTIAADSARVTATTTNGVAEVIDIISTVSGGFVVVRF